MLTRMTGFIDFKTAKWSTGYVRNKSAQKSSGFASVILIFVFVLAVAVVGAYYYGKNSNKNSFIPVSPVASSQSSPSASAADETANWQTYINTRYGFSIKYPHKDMEPILCKDETNQTNANFGDANYVDFDNPEVCVGTGKPSNFTISVYPNGSSETYPKGTNITQSNEQLGEYTWQAYHLTVPENGQTSSYEEYSYVLKRGTTEYEFHTQYLPSVPVLKKILSTFKFTK